MSLLTDLGRLRPETDEQRAATAKIGEADIAEARARMSELSVSGQLLDKGGNVMRFPAREAREMLEAKVV